MAFEFFGVRKQNGGQCHRAYGEVNDLGGPVIPGTTHCQRSWTDRHCTVDIVICLSQVTTTNTIM